jgi:translation initiation factor IF-1
MPGEDAFKVEGVIVEAVPNGTYLAELANGHRLLAFVPGKAKDRIGRLGVGSRVRMQLSPYDLSEGRVLEKI